MTNFSFFVVLIFVILKNSLALWNPNLQLKNLLKGNCRLISPRVCKSISGFNPDFHCGFILRHVCYGQDNLSPDQYLRDKNLHVTPLPRSFQFYDIDRDGVISLKEFARTLGHDPHELHVKVAFFSADRDGNQVIDHREFRHNDVWVFERRRHVSVGQKQVHVSAGRRRSGNAQSSSSEESMENDVSNKRFSDDNSEESSEDVSFEHFRGTSSEEFDAPEIKNSKKESRDEVTDDHSTEKESETEDMFSSEEKEHESKEEEEEEDSIENNNAIEKEENDDKSDEMFEINSTENESRDMESMEDTMEEKKETDVSSEIDSTDKSDELGKLNLDPESSENDRDFEERDEKSDEQIESALDDTSSENERDLSVEEKEIDDVNSKESIEKLEFDDSSEEKAATSTKSKDKKEVKLSEILDLKGFTKKKGGVFRHSLEVMKNVVKALAKTENQQADLLVPSLTEHGLKAMKMNMGSITEKIVEEKRPSEEVSVVGPNTILWVSVPSKRSRPSF